MFPQSLITWVVNTIFLLMGDKMPLTAEAIFGKKKPDLPGIFSEVETDKFDTAWKKAKEFIRQRGYFAALDDKL